MNFSMTKHALSRALDMAVSPDEIRETLYKPRKILRSLKYPDVLIRSNGRIAMPVDEDGAVITVLWHREASDPRFDRNNDIERIRDKS